MTTIGAVAPQALVILPTRELSTQVLSAARSFCSPIPNVKIVSITGGTPAKAQVIGAGTIIIGNVVDFHSS